MQLKTETQFQVVSSADAQHILDYLPIITRAIQDDPRYKNKRSAFVRSINAMNGSRREAFDS